MDYSQFPPQAGAASPGQYYQTAPLQQYQYKQQPQGTGGGGDGGGFPPPSPQHYYSIGARANITADGVIIPVIPEPRSAGAMSYRSGFSTNAPPSAASGHTSAGNESIRVVVRVRPFNDGEQTYNSTGSAVEVGDDHRTLQLRAPNMDERAMTFNHVFDEGATQTDVFEQCGVKNLVEKALEGYATTIFAFGQTGSGKSYTVTGEKNFEFDAYQSGLVLRSLRYLYDQVTERSHIKFNIKAAYLEIYNEHVQDLMSLTNTVSLPVRFQASRGFYVENLLVLDCHAIDDCVAVLQEGLRNRTTRAHQLNEHSSRSHSIMTVYIDTEQPDPNGGKPLVKHGKISFVDLAGSEKVRETKSTGETFNEMLNINKSLLTLGNCISALSDPKKRGGHIPYRDSNLTRLLADSLGGSGLALMIACVSPSGRHASETLKTLRYAQRTKRIRNRPIVHMDPRDEVVENLTKEVTQLRIENQYLKSMLGGSGMVSSNVSSGYVSPRSISSVDRGGGGVSLPSIPSGPVSYTGSPAPSSVGSSASHWRQSTSGSSVSEYAGGMQSPASMHSPSVGYASGRRSASSRPVKSSPLNSSKTHSGKTNIPAPPITTYTGQSRRQLGTKRHAVASSAPEMRSSTVQSMHTPVPPQGPPQDQYHPHPPPFPSHQMGSNPSYYPPPGPPHSDGNLPYGQYPAEYQPRYQLPSPAQVAQTRSKLTDDVQALNQAIGQMRVGTQ